MFIPIIKIKKHCDQCDFHHDMVVGRRWAGLGVLDTVNLEFPQKTVSRKYTEQYKSRKHSVSTGSEG